MVTKNRILDIGAGECPHTIATDALDFQTRPPLERLTKFRKIECRKKFKQLVSNKRYLFKVDYTKDRFPYESGTFSMVISSFSIGSSKERVHVYHEIKRVLVDGGKVVITVGREATKDSVVKYMKHVGLKVKVHEIKPDLRNVPWTEWKYLISDWVIVGMK